MYVITSGNDLAMEFADKIRIPKLNGVTMRGPHIPNTSTGTLVITGHHLIFSSISEDVELWVIMTICYICRWKVVCKVNYYIFINICIFDLKDMITFEQQI